jgi:hypothetical protein
MIAGQSEWKVSKISSRFILTKGQITTGHKICTFSVSLALGGLKSDVQVVVIAFSVVFGLCALTRMIPGPIIT